MNHSSHPSPAPHGHVLAGQDAWRLLRRMALACLVVTLVFGVVGLALVWLIPGNAGPQEANAAMPAATVLGLAQLAGLLATGVAGWAYLSVLRGSDPSTRVLPTAHLVRLIGVAQLVGVALLGAYWLVAAAHGWVLTLSLMLVSAQAGVALLFLARLTRRDVADRLQRARPRG